MVEGLHRGMLFVVVAVISQNKASETFRAGRQSNTSWSNDTERGAVEAGDDSHNKSTRAPQNRPRLCYMLRAARTCILLDTSYHAAVSDAIWLQA